MKYKYTITNEKKESDSLWGNISSKFKKKINNPYKEPSYTSIAEADNEDDARAIARRHIRKYYKGYRLGSIHEVEG